MTKYVITLSLLIHMATVCSGQDSDILNTDEPIKFQRINSPVKLDGMSDEIAWEGIVSLPMLMRAPNSGNEPSERTEILIGYDDDYIYAAGRFYDSEPSKIQATSLKRDGGWTWSTDAMSIIFDTFNDNAVDFLTTPAGTRTDVNILNDGVGVPYRNANPSWNAFWDAATLSNDEGWFAEVRIPFSSLRFEEKDGNTVMGLIAYRLLPRKGEFSTFPLIPEKYGIIQPSQAKEVLFEGIKSHHSLYITPYILGGLGQSYELNEDEAAYGRNDKCLSMKQDWM
ncbi:MAG: carbohydrate binding family 9 domain-containing protein [Bacteroidales bacterium]